MHGVETASRVSEFNLLQRPWRSCTAGCQRSHGCRRSRPHAHARTNTRSSGRTRG